MVHVDFRCRGSLAMISKVLRKPSWETRVGKENFARNIDRSLRCLWGF